MKPKYQCTHCGRDEITARAEGCGEPAPRFVDVPYSDGFHHWVSRERVNACPMDIKSPIRRFLFNMFGIMP
jgi:hypothetical protein